MRAPIDRLCPRLLARWRSGAPPVRDGGQTSDPEAPSHDAGSLAPLTWPATIHPRSPPTMLSSSICCRPSLQIALGELEPTAMPVEDIWRVSRPCWTLRCNGCRRQLAADGGHRHWSSQAAARQAADDQGWDGELELCPRAWRWSSRSDAAGLAHSSERPRSADSVRQNARLEDRPPEFRGHASATYRRPTARASASMSPPCTPLAPSNGRSVNVAI